MRDVLRPPPPPGPVSHRGTQHARLGPSRGRRTDSASTRRQPLVGGRAPKSPWEVEDPFLREAASEAMDLAELEAAHGSYSVVGGVQRGADMIRPGPAPGTYMPHLNAHAEYSHHLQLPYDMSHVHPSMYEGAPLIRGFPAHDRILETMQQNNAENYPRQNQHFEGGWEDRRSGRRSSRR
jgi:hypothetical protein